MCDIIQNHLTCIWIYIFFISKYATLFSYMLNVEIAAVNLWQLEIFQPYNNNIEQLTVFEEFPA